MVLTLLRCNSDWKPDCHDFYRLQSTYEAAHVFLWVTSPSQTFVTPPLWPPSWSLTCWQQRRPFPTMVAWHSSSSCTSLGLIPSPKKRRFHPPGDDLWSLGGHLQASALQSDHDQTEVCCHDCCFLRWAFLCSFGQFLVSFSLSTVLWPQGNRSLLLPWVSVAETGLHWQHQNRSPGHRRFGPHGPGDFCGLVDILLYPTPLAVPTSLWWFCFFAPLFYVYFRPVTTLPEDKVFPLLCTIIAPMLNPLIYTVRNFEMKNSIKKL